MNDMKKIYIPESLITYGFISFLIALSFYAASYFIEPAPPRAFKLASGSEGGAYYAFAQDYKKTLEDSGTKVEVITTSGSLENIELLQKGEVDFAFIQSGLASYNLDPEQNEGLQSLGSLYFEPLWIFTRASFKANSLQELKGLTIAVGGIGSGTRAVANQVLESSGIYKGDTKFLDIGGEKAFEYLKNGKVDIVFISSGLSSNIIQKFVKDPELSLLSERRAPAFDKRYPFLSHLTLPEGVLDLAHNIPPQQTELLSSAALLVAGPDAHQTLKALMVHTAHSIHNQNPPYLQDIAFPNPDFSDFPLADEADRYYKYGPSFLQRYLPFWVADLIDRLKVMLIPLITIMFPLMKIAPPTYRWRIRSKIYKWYKDLKAAEGLDGSSTRDVQDALVILDNMDKEAKQTPVPLSYTDALYNLRMHISLVKEKLLKSHPQASETKD